MDANAPRDGGSAGRTLAVALTVVSLVAVVAIASGGSTPRGGIGAHRPSEGLLDAGLSLLVVVMAVFGALAVVMLPLFGRDQFVGRGRAGRSPLRTLLRLILSIALLALLVHVLAGSTAQRLRAPSTADGAAVRGGDTGGYEPRFVLWPVIVVGVLAALAGVGWWLGWRGRRSFHEPVAATPDEALADVLAETLDDLRAEGDARRAVIKAYGRMERSLAASGLPRGAAEAPEEYLERVLTETPVSRRSATRLTSLFAWARFSGHDVRPEMKDDAIETLERVQRELAAEAAGRSGELAGAAA